MQSQFAFFASIAFSLIAWGIVAARYIWPELRLRGRAQALRPLLILHSFRFIGLAVLVPGVVSPDLPPAFAAIAAQRGWSCHGMDLQLLGFSRSPQRFLPSQSRRTVGGAVGSRILPSNSRRSVAPDHARTRFPH